MKIFITEREQGTNAILGLQRYDKSGLLEEADTNDPEIVVFYQTRQDTKDAESLRQEGIEAGKMASGLKEISIDQANTYIDNQLDDATTIAQLREATKVVLKKMIPFLLQ